MKYNTLFWIFIPSGSTKMSDYNIIPSHTEIQNYFLIVKFKLEWEYLSPTFVNWIKKWPQ